MRGRRLVATLDLEARPDQEPTTITDLGESRALAVAAADAATTKKASDVRILELGSLLAITDFFVLVSATNERQLDTVVEEIERQLKAGGIRPRRREGTKDTGWMILDYGDIVVHAFTAEQRRFYNLERLWSDAPVVPYLEGASPQPDGRVSTAASAPDGQ